MRTLYFECNMGAAGDMLMGALLELMPDKEAFLEKLNQAGLPGVEITATPSVKCGITGTHVSVKFHGTEEESLDLHGKNMHVHEQSHGHSHTGMQEISERIEQLHVDEKVKNDVKNIYRIIADAESKVHGKMISDIHFHEVGTADALADITGCAMLIRELKVEKIVVSPISTGFGQVRCAHGILSVPAPATALILQGLPCKAGSVEGELCTPTGAAILKYFADEYSRMPEMIMEKIGYGMGKKDFRLANCVRAILGNTI